MKILSFNVCYCIGMNRPSRCWRYFFPNRTIINQVADFVRLIQPDVVAFTEIDSGSMRSSFCNQIRIFEENAGFFTHFYHSKYGRFLRKLPILRHQCNAVLTKQSKTSCTHHYLRNGIKRLVIHATIRSDIDLFIVHFSLGKKQRAAQIEELGHLLESSKCHKIVTGDFNVFDGMQELASLLQKANLRSVNQDHVQTFPSWKPRHELDFFLVSPGITVKRFEVLQTALSDHLPIFLEIV